MLFLHCCVVSKKFLAEILAAKKLSYTSLAKEINSTKEEMDKSLARLAKLKADREARGIVHQLDIAHLPV